jgi:hypothetical protein
MNKLTENPWLLADPFWILYISNGVSKLHVVINGIFTDDSFESSISNKKVLLSRLTQLETCS